MMNLQVQMGPKVHKVQVPAQCTAQQLKEELQGLTGIPARKMKLIHKGKVLEGTQALTGAGVIDGGKLMCLASAEAAANAGSHTLTKGQQAAQTAAQQRAAEARERVEAAFAAARGGGGAGAVAAAAAAASKAGGAAGGVRAGAAGAGSQGLSNLAERRANWLKTGIIALRDLGLTALPPGALEGLGASTSLSTGAGAGSEAQAAAGAPSQQQQQQQGGQQGRQQQVEQQQGGQQGMEVDVPQGCQGEEQQQQAAGAGPAAAETAAAAGSLDATGAQSQGRAQNGSSSNLAASAEVTGPAGGAQGGQGAVIRHLDASCNRLTALPAAVGALQGLVSLKLASNALTDAGMPWAELGRLGALTALHLDSNCLAELPGQALGGLTSLVRLSLSSNRLSRLPPELGRLGMLRQLLLDENALEGALPQELGGCSALVELSACGNRLDAIPPALAGCSQLEALRLERNRISAVPQEVLEGCGRLWLLALAANPISAEQLRAAPGWAAYDARRRAKADKQLEGGVLLDGSRAFAEGADAEDWAHWGASKKPGFR